MSLNASPDATNSKRLAARCSGELDAAALTPVTDVREVTSAIAVNSTVEGFGLGADDYVTKPVRGAQGGPPVSKPI